MPKFNVTLTNVPVKHDKDGNVIPSPAPKPVVIEAPDAPAAKAKAIAQLKPESNQDVEVNEVAVEAA